MENRRKQSAHFCLEPSIDIETIGKCSIHFQALFLAHGPAFKTNYTTEPFENIELYNLMAGKVKKFIHTFFLYFIGCFHVANSRTCFFLPQDFEICP